MVSCKKFQLLVLHTTSDEGTVGQAADNKEPGGSLEQNFLELLGTKSSGGRRLRPGSRASRHPARRAHHAAAAAAPSPHVLAALKLAAIFSHPEFSSFPHPSPLQKKH